jgi:hypothetical protein
MKVNFKTLGMGIASLSMEISHSKPPFFNPILDNEEVLSNPYVPKKTALE